MVMMLVASESTHVPTYFFFCVSYPVTPWPWNARPPNSPSKSFRSQRPPGKSLSTSTPLETVGSESGPDIQLLTVASQVPTSLASSLCPAVGLAPGGPSCALTTLAGPTTPRAKHVATNNWFLICMVFPPLNRNLVFGPVAVSDRHTHLSSKKFVKTNKAGISNIE